MVARRILAVMLGLASLLPAGAQALPSPVKTGWLPSNAGIFWWQSPEGSLTLPRQPAGGNGGAWWLTRRPRTSPLLPEVQHLGSLLHGIYLSVGGGAWVNRTPACLLPLTSPTPAVPQPVYRATRDALVAATGMDACGVEGIAYDPVLPGRMYASGFDIDSIGLSGAVLRDGGVYVSDDLGGTWRKLLGGIRGNGLAVARTGIGSARLVVGYIQVHNGAIGSTPGNGSLSISDDDGETWRSVVLPPSGCPENVETSQRLTPTVVINPADPDIIYAGTNAGAYVSTDGGGSWTLARASCGGVWGIAVSPDGSKVWFGDNTGAIRSGDADASPLTVVTDLGTGRIQDLLADPYDQAGRRLYAAVWDGGSAGVHRVDGTSGASAKLGDAVLGPLDGDAVPRPFPLSPTMAGGSQPALFLSRPPGRLMLGTILRGAFLRLE